MRTDWVRVWSVNGKRRGVCAKVSRWGGGRQSNGGVKQDQLIESSGKVGWKFEMLSLQDTEQVWGKDYKEGRQCRKKARKLNSKGGEERRI